MKKYRMELNAEIAVGGGEKEKLAKYWKQVRNGSL